MIEIHLYGKLRRHASSTNASSESVLEIEPREGETVRTLMERTGLAQDDICHIFLNGRLVSTENSMAPWLEYREGEGGGLDTPLAKGDRLGLFARDMALLVV